MMRSASLIFSAKSRVSKRSSMPGFNCASRNAWRPPPIPPAAPAPGCKDTSLPVVWNMTSERCCIATSSSFTISASAREEIRKKNSACNYCRCYLLDRCQWDRIGSVLRRQHPGSLYAHHPPTVRKYPDSLLLSPTDSDHSAFHPV